MATENLKDTWRKYRWVLFLIGTVFASLITHFMSMGMFGTSV